MGKTLDLGRRIELLPSDKHCGDISLGLYKCDVDQVAHFLVHTYSAEQGTTQRVAFIMEAMVVILGMEVTSAPGTQSGWLHFPCGASHERALKRAFLDLCKLETKAPLEPKPLTAFDKKANGTLTAAPLGGGVYQIDAESGSETGPRRAAAVARGFAKLCEMDPIEGSNQIVFPCKSSHDHLISMLMFRAQNVRASIQEQEMSASRGVLSSPSQQK